MGIGFFENATFLRISIEIHQTGLSSLTSNKPWSSGGIGRHARLRILCRNRRAGSSPALTTRARSHQSGLFVFHDSERVIPFLKLFDLLESEYGRARLRPGGDHASGIASADAVQTACAAVALRRRELDPPVARIKIFWNALWGGTFICGGPVFRYRGIRS